MLDGYIICGTPRSGSTLLCDLLESTTRCGTPNSYFDPRFIPEWAEEWGLPAVTPQEAPSLDVPSFDTAYLEAAIEVGKASSEIFALRLMRETLESLSATLHLIYPGQPSDKARLEKAFGSRLLYLHLSRADKLAQAISYIKAEQTGLWHQAPDGSEIERLSPPQDPHYDFNRIAQEVAKLEAYDKAWNSWFEAQGIAPLRLSYESLAADPAQMLLQVCEALGVEAPPDDEIKPGVAKLADDISLDWMRRYRQDLAAAV